MPTVLPDLPCNGLLSDTLHSSTNFLAATKPQIRELGETVTERLGKITIEWHPICCYLM